MLNKDGKERIRKFIKESKKDHKSRPYTGRNMHTGKKFSFYPEEKREDH